MNSMSPRGCSTPGEKRPSMAFLPPIQFLQQPPTTDTQTRFSKLIDISSLANPSGGPSAPEDNVDDDHPSRSEQDYEKFFNDTFQTARRPTSSSGRPAIHHDTFVPPSASSEQDWLRSVILRDPKDRSWDYNRVVKIGKPLIISFDDIVASDENEQPAAGATKHL